MASTTQPPSVPPVPRATSLSSGALASTAVDTSPRWLTRLVYHSLSSAACAIVPIPLLDDHLVNLTRRRMTREIAADQGRELQRGELLQLSGTEGRALSWGCFVGLAFSLTFKIVVKLIRRIFRTLLFWLLIKDAADAASRTFHEGFLVRAALSRQVGGNTAVLRAHVDGALRRADTGSLTHLFRGVLAGSKRLILGVARGASRLVGLRREKDDGEERLDRSLEDAIPASLVERMTHAISAESIYLKRLDELIAEQFFLATIPAARPSDSADPSSKRQT